VTCNVHQPCNLRRMPYAQRQTAPLPPRCEEKGSAGERRQSKSHVTRHTSHVTRHTSPVSNISRVQHAVGAKDNACCIWTLTIERHASHVTRHTSHVTRHTSHVTRHTSHVTRHTSHVTSASPVVPLKSASGTVSKTI